MFSYLKKVLQYNVTVCHHNYIKYEKAKLHNLQLVFSIIKNNKTCSESILLPQERALF